MRNTISNQINYGRGLLYLLRHIECLIKLVGVDYVGIGSDFDGFVVPPQKLDDISTYPLITKALVEKGYAQKGLNKFWEETF